MDLGGIDISFLDESKTILYQLKTWEFNAVSLDDLNKIIDKMLCSDAIIHDYNEHKFFEKAKFSREVDYRILSESYPDVEINLIYTLTDTPLIDTCKIDVLISDADRYRDRIAQFYESRIELESNTKIPFGCSLEPQLMSLFAKVDEQYFTSRKKRNIDLMNSYILFKGH